MSSIEDISNGLQNVEDRISIYERRLGCEREKLLKMMSTAQEEFGKTREGQEFILSVSAALSDLIIVDRLLYITETTIRSCKDRIRK